MAGGVEGAPGQIAHDGLPGERTGWTDEHVDNGVRGEPESAPGHGGTAGAGAQGNDGAGADKAVKDEPQGGQSTTGTTAKTTAKAGAVERTTGPRPRDFETGKPATAPGQPTTPQTAGTARSRAARAGGQGQASQGQGGGSPQPNGGTTTDPKGQGGADGTTARRRSSRARPRRRRPVRASGGKDTETG